MQDSSLLYKKDLLVLSVIEAFIEFMEEFPKNHKGSQE